MSRLAEGGAAQLGEGGVEERMAAGPQGELAARRHLRHAAAGQLGEAVRGLQQVEVGEQGGVGLDRRQGGARPAQQLGEDAPALGLLVLAGLLQRVVLLDHAQRLEVEALAGARAAVDQAGGTAAGAGLEHHHQAAAAHRDGLLAELVAMLADEASELAVELVAHGADAAAQRHQLGAGVLPHVAAAVEAGVDLAHQGGEVGQLLDAGGELGARRVGGADAARRRAGGAQQGAQAHQVGAAQRRPAALQAVQQIGQGLLEGGHQAAVAGQPRRLLPSPPLCRQPVLVGERFEGQDALLAEVAGRQLRDQAQQGGPLESGGGGGGEDRFGAHGSTSRSFRC